MKTTFKTILAAILVAASVATYANKKDDKFTVKSRQMVEKATPDDWKTLAEAASICVSKKTNLTEASAWLDKSISIKETAYNLEVKGDYYLISNLSDKAIASYIKAMQTGLRDDAGFDVKPLQTKIAELNKK